MPDPSDLTLGVLFRAREDPNFKRIVRRLHTIVTGFQQGMAKVDAAAKKTEQSIARIDAASRRAEKGLRDTGAAADFTGKQIGKLHGGVQRLIAAFKVVAVYTLSGTLFYGFTKGLREGISEIINFDQALANLKAITGATDAEIRSMRESLKETALRTKFSTTEIAEGMVLLGQAGLTAGESMQAIDAVADLAAGTLSDFAAVSDLVTTALRAFNMDASETRRIADVMANAVNKSKLTIDKLRTAFNYVGAAAAQAGLTIEQTAASMMVLANNGMRASTIGTGLRQVLSRLLSPNAKIKQAMEAYGLTLDKTTGKADWFQKQITKLATVIYNFKDDTVDMAKAYELFGLRGAQAAAILVKSFMSLDGTWATMLGKVKEIGTAQSMMEDQAEGLGFKIKNLGDSFGVLAINLGEAGFTGALELATDAVRALVQFLARNANTVIGSTIATFVGLASVLYVVKLAVVALNQAFSVAGTGLIKFFLNPVGAIILIVAALGAAIYGVERALKRQRDIMEQNAVKSKALAGGLRAYLSELDKVKEGSDEYNLILDRMKEEYKDIAPLIDKMRGNYKALREEIVQVAHEERKRSVYLRSELLTVNKPLIKFLHDYEVELNKAAAYSRKAPSMEQWMTLPDYSKTRKAISEYVQSVGEIFIQQMNEGKTRKEIEEQMAKGSGPFGFLQALSRYPELTAKIYKDIMAIVNAHEAQLAAQAKARADAMTDRISLLPKKWRDMLDQAWAGGDYLKFLDILEAITQGYNKWEQREKEFIRSYLERHKTMVGSKEALDKLRLQFWDKHLAEFLSKGDKANKKELKDYQKHIDNMVKYRYEKFGTSFDKEYLKIKTYYDKLEKEIRDEAKTEKQVAAELAELWAGFYADLQELVDKYGYMMNITQLEEIKAKMKELAGYAGVANASIPSRSPDTERDRMTPEEWKEYQENLLKYEYEENKRLAKEKGDEAEKAYRRGEISAEEYFAALREMEKYDLITWKEYLDKKRRETQGAFDNFKEGWKDFFGSMETWGEWFYNLGQEIPERLADGFADMWGDFLTGTKSAKEAFADFARDTLRWLAQMLAKRAMLSMMGSFFGGAAHSGGVGTGEWGPPTRKLKGITFAPKLHSGLMPDEFPAILKKDEGVFTKRQMQALGMMVNSGTQISVPVNVNGGNSEQLKRYLPAEIEDAVLKTMRRYM